MTEKDKKRVRDKTLYYVNSRCPQHDKRMVSDGKWIMCPVDDCSHKQRFTRPTEEDDE